MLSGHTGVTDCRGLSRTEGSLGKGTFSLKPEFQGLTSRGSHPPQDPLLCWGPRGNVDWNGVESPLRQTSLEWPPGHMLMSALLAWVGPGSRRDEEVTPSPLWAQPCLLAPGSASQGTHFPFLSLDSQYFQFPSVSLFWCLSATLSSSAQPEGRCRWGVSLFPSSHREGPGVEAQ